MTDLGDIYAQAIFGQNAIRVPTWMYARDQGAGVVMLVGASKTEGDHPLRYGSPTYDERGDRSYHADHFILGEIIVRPRLVIATSIMEGESAGGMLTNPRSIEEMTARGAVVLGQAQ